MGKRDDELALERRRARERMRYVEPENCGKILAHDRYWTRQFLERYLERCDAATHVAPREAYLLAQPLDQLATRIRVGPGPGDYENEGEKASFEVRALAVQASTCRGAPDDLGEDEAALAFKRAFAILRRGRKLAPSAVADLERRYAGHLARSGETSECRRHLDRALEICERHDEPAGAADALLLRGTLSDDPKSAIDLVQVLRLADHRTGRGKRAYAAALRELTGMLLVRGKGLRAQEKAVKALAEPKNRLKGKSLSKRKVALVWIEGLLLRNLGVDRHADRQLEKARSGFQDLEEAVEFALASLDRADLLVTGGETERASSLRSQTLEWLRAHADDPRLLALAQQWTDECDLIELRKRLTTLRNHRTAAARP